MPQRAAVAETGDVAIDQSWIALAEARAVESELRRKIGKHPLGRILNEKESSDRHAAPVLNLHWDGTGARAT